MKVILRFFFLVIILQLPASTRAQNVTLSIKDFSLRETMRNIRQQTGYGFMFYTKRIKSTKKISLNLKNVPIDSAMKEVLAEQPYYYKINNKIITLITKDTATKTDTKKSIDLMGTILDEKCQPVSFASVRVKGEKNKDTIANENGEFFIHGMPDNGIITVSCVGFNAVEIYYSGEKVEVCLQSKCYSLATYNIEENYFNTNMKYNTGDVGIISAEEIAKQLVNDPMIAVEGKVSGLYIIQSSGAPNAAVSVSLRGPNSIANGNAPLYLLDGVPFNSSSLSQVENGTPEGRSPFESINPNDIENIVVLKDADATAIYGSRGANGVILFSTKKAKAGSPRFEVNVQNGIGAVTKKLALMNTQQYLALRREAYKNDGITPKDNDIDGTWDTLHSIDWQRKLIGGVAKFTNVNTSFSTVVHFTRIMISGSYAKEGTVWPGDFQNQTGSGAISLFRESSDRRLQMNAHIAYTNSTGNQPQIDPAKSIYTAPNAPENYLDSALSTTSGSITQSLQSNFFVSYNILKGLQLKLKGGDNYIQLDEHGSMPRNRARNSLNTWILEPQASYTKRWTRNRIDLLFGVTLQENLQCRSLVSDTSVKTPTSIEAPDLNNYAINTLYRYDAFFARLSYLLADKYMVNLTGRRDGSSRFGPSKRFGNFGAVGLGWLFTEEKFFHNTLPFLSHGKVRGSFGVTGNDQLPDYQYLSTYNTGLGYQNIAGLYPTQIGNSSFGWETLKKLEAALELGFAQDHVLLTVVYYRNQTSNQLVGHPLPTLTGFSNVMDNQPVKIGNMGLEADVNVANVKLGPITWNSSFNISFPDNKLVEYPGIERSVYATQYSVGHSLLSKRVYHLQNVDPATGIYQFDDRDKNGVIDQNDKVLKSVGQKFFGGINNSFIYRRWYFSFFCQFVKQTGFEFPGYVMPGSFLATGSNPTLDLLQRWKNPGDLATYQKASAGNAIADRQYALYRQSDAVLKDASFIRLKNLYLSYSLLSSEFTWHGFKNPFIYIEAQNVLTITKFKGTDPETPKYLQIPVLPPFRIVTVGFKSNF